MKMLSPAFLDENVHDITVLDIQTEINRISKDKSPKTARNYHGFISAVLGIYCTGLSIPHFPLHKLRHYFASKMSAMNIPEEDIMRFGGWGTDYVMKGVYRHAMQDRNRDAQRKVSKKPKTYTIKGLQLFLTKLFNFIKMRHGGIEPPTT